MCAHVVYSEKEAEGKEEISDVKDVYLTLGHSKFLLSSSASHRHSAF